MLSSVTGRGCRITVYTLVTFARLVSIRCALKDSNSELFEKGIILNM